MKKIHHQLSILLVVIFAGFFFTSCNKSLEQPAAIVVPPYPTGNGITTTLAANANYSFYSALIARAGMTSLLNDSTKTFTLYATDNNGMKLFVNAASGGLVPLASPDAVFLGFISTSLPAASAAGIVQYNTIGTSIPLASISNAFPNFPLTSQIVLSTTQPFVRLPIFPVRGTPYSYVNNLPITAAEIVAANGVIETGYSVAAPPQLTLKQMIATEPTLTYFRAAIARADSGAVGLNKLDSLLGYGVTNMTVLAPNDAAMQPALYGALYYGLLAQGVPSATANTQATFLASTPGGFNYLPLATVKGIVAYHFLASLNTLVTPSAYQPNIRVFSNNFSATPSFVKTLVNSSIAAHPGISAVASFTGPAVSSLKFVGYGSFPITTTPYTSTAVSAVKMDNHAVNGVYHIINGVLLPQ